MADKSIIIICGNCQKEFNVDLQGLTNVSHGICKRHAIDMLKSIGLDGASGQFANKFKGGDDKDLSDPQRLAAKRAEIKAAANA